MQKVSHNGFSEIGMNLGRAGRVNVPGFSADGFKPDEVSRPNIWGMDHMYVVTPADCARLGVKAPKPPAAETCQFCGALLQPFGVRFPGDGTKVNRWLGIEHCTCPKAVAHWKYKGEKTLDEARVQASFGGRRAITPELMAAMGVPAMYRTAKSDELPVKDDLKKQLEAYRCGMDLVITADAGDADTRQKAAAVALRRALDSNAVRTAHWLAESEIATVEKDRGDLTAIKELEERLEKSPLLVIAELGVSRFTPFNFERFYFSINLRHSEGLRTIYTTPHKRLSDLTARWTEQGCGNPEQIDRICEILAKNATMV